MTQDRPSKAIGARVRAGALALLREAITLQMQQVHYFLALCEELSFTRAGRRCGVSQPTLTNAIIALERALGGALFQRKPTIALTGLSRMVRPYLHDIARNAQQRREVARSLSSPPGAYPAALQVAHNSERPPS